MDKRVGVGDEILIRVGRSGRSIVGHVVLDTMLYRLRMSHRVLVQRCRTNIPFCHASSAAVQKPGDHLRVS